MMKFLQIIKENMSDVNDKGVVKVNYKALKKFLEKNEELNLIEIGEDIPFEDESQESYGNAMITVNYGTLSKLIEQYEKRLMNTENHKQSN